MTDHYDKLHAETVRAHAKAARAQAMASAGALGILQEHPLKFLVVSIVLGIWMIMAMHESSKRNRAENEAWYQAKLECRKTGGSFEYFGTQGYHCIGRKK